MTDTTPALVEQSAASSITARLATMGHELRTPLNSVIGLSSVLGRQISGPLNDKQAEYVAQIEASGRHLLALIANILDLAKADAEMLRAERAVVEVAGLLREAVAMVEPMALERRIDLCVGIPPRTTAIEADPLRAKQVLLNLLSNAIKFTESGGSVGVRVRQGTDLVDIEVWDTGIGIPADALERIFEPFEQLDSPLSPPGEGTGLGLALSRRLAELQGGRLVVRSVEGEGSTFRASFRAAAVESGAVDASTRPDPELTIPADRPGRPQGAGVVCLSAPRRLVQEPAGGDTGQGLLLTGAA